MKNLVCFLEEPSAKEMLQGILPRLLPGYNTTWCYIPIVFEGKQDLEKQLVRKLRGWQKADSVFLILRDQDSADCKAVKKQLHELCGEAGRPGALVRIACHELESFYFGDLPAVERGLEVKNIACLQQKAKYRTPDRIVNPCDELEKLTHGVYQQISGSRRIAPLLSLENNFSHSFNVLLSGIRGILGGSQGS